MITAVSMWLQQRHQDKHVTFHETNQLIKVAELQTVDVGDEEASLSQLRRAGTTAFCFCFSLPCNCESVSIVSLRVCLEIDGSASVSVPSFTTFWLRRHDHKAGGVKEKNETPPRPTTPPHSPTGCSVATSPQQPIVNTPSQCRLHNIVGTC